MTDQTMRVAISGASGLLGGALGAHLTAAGHDVVAMVRHRDQVQPGDIYWSGPDGEIDHAALARVDAVVHLAGEPLGERWTDAQKQRIHDSRVEGTALVAGAMAALGDDGPRVLIQGSAVGYYGSRGDQRLTEEATRGEGFLADVVVAWEAAAAPAEAAGIRVVYHRTGVVLAQDGPLIDKVELPFKLGIGGVIGDGTQWVPWISLRDTVRAQEFLLTHDISGPVNVVAPSCVTNRQLVKAIGEVMHRPTIIPTPIFGIRLLYGEMGVTLATDSQRVVPEKLQQAGFTWEDHDVHTPLREALA